MLDLQDMTAVKRCSKCGCEKPIAVFRLRVKSKPSEGRRSWCSECDSRAGSSWYRKHKEHVRARCRDWYKSNKDKSLAYTRKWRMENISNARRLDVENRRKRRYGVSREKYAEMVAKSGGLCAICRQPFSGYPHIDHDHATGSVRELLCGKCNPALGNFCDSVEILEAAIAYLKKHGGKA